MKITEGFVALVTGGASGLGEATVRMLHLKGASVAILDMNDDKLEQMKSDLGSKVLCIKCDVTQESEVRDAVNLCINAFG